MVSLEQQGDGDVGRRSRHSNITFDYTLRLGLGHDLSERWDGDSEREQSQFIGLWELPRWKEVSFEFGKCTLAVPQFPISMPLDGQPLQTQGNCSASS